ncbi:MAG: host attachment protein [Pseudomonadota bacterium]
MESAMKPLRILYLIASEDGFRLLQSHAPDLAEIAVRKADDFADVHYTYPSEQSRSHTGPHGASFDVTGSANKVEQERLRLARHVVAALQVEWAKSTHDRIILAAGPKMLGALRDAMPKDLHAHVAAEVHKDLMKVPAHDLLPHFKEVTQV